MKQKVLSKKWKVLIVMSSTRNTSVVRGQSRSRVLSTFHFLLSTCDFEDRHFPLSTQHFPLWY
jgi:hypothetical protein